MIDIGLGLSIICPSLMLFMLFGGCDTRMASVRILKFIYGLFKRNVDPYFPFWFNWFLPSYTLYC